MEVQLHVLNIHVRWVPCRNGMMCPQVVNGGECLQIWKVSVNILNKQSRTADKGWTSSLSLDMGLTTPHLEKIICYKMFQSASDLD
jgi:hypothetical protein